MCSPRWEAMTFALLVVHHLTRVCFWCPAPELSNSGEEDEEDVKDEPMSAKEEVESPPRHKRARTGEAAGGGEDMSMLVDGQPVDEEQG